MFKGKRILAIIPARGGSKGLPGKNIKMLLGKPLIAWSIEMAKKSNYIDKIVVSTDDNEIAEISGDYGIAIDGLRPSYLAGDEARTFDVIVYEIEKLKKYNQNFDVVVLLEPTAPIREIGDIDNSIELLINSNYSSLVSICKSQSNHPDFQFRIGADSRLVSYLEKDFIPRRRQDIDEAYFLVGTIYASFVEDLIKTETFCNNSTIGLEVEKWKSFEIDDYLDFQIIETILLTKLKTL
jgi:CMP-N,N'-diacetyllegionaminic acid synthase